MGIASQQDVPGLPKDLLQRVLEKLVSFEPDTVAVLLRGSYATGAATPESDLDLTAITVSVPRTPYRTWFEERAAEPLLVSVSAKQVRRWLAKNDCPAEWALGFPATDVATYVWATDEARQVLGGDPSTMRPRGVPCIEDFVNTAIKVRRAWRLEDELAVRLYGRETALLAPALLIPLNEERVVTDSRSAMLAALELRVAPEHYRDDFRVAVGLEPTEAGAVAAAVLRLATELLAFLRERAPEIDPQPEIARYLTDGTFERYLIGSSG